MLRPFASLLVAPLALLLAGCPAKDVPDASVTSETDGASAADASSAATADAATTGGSVFVQSSSSTPALDRLLPEVTFLHQWTMKKVPRGEIKSPIGNRPMLGLTESNGIATLVAIDEARHHAVVRIEAPPTSATEVGREIISLDWSSHEATTIAEEKNLAALAESGVAVDAGGGDAGPAQGAGSLASVAAHARALAFGGPPFVDTRVATSPDGSSIFFLAAAVLYRTDASGNNPTRFGSARESSEPMVSPKNDVLAYVGCDSGCEDAKKKSLRLASIGKTVPAANDAGAGTMKDGGAVKSPSDRTIGAVVDPAILAFSSDGASLYATSTPDNEKPSCFYAVTVASGEAKKLACAAAKGVPSFAVSPNGKLAVFVSLGEGGASESILIDLATGKPKGAPRKVVSMDVRKGQFVLTDDARIVSAARGLGAGSGITIIPLATEGDAGATEKNLHWEEAAYIKGLRHAGPRSIAFLVTRRNVLELDMLEIAR